MERTSKRRSCVRTSNAPVAIGRGHEHRTAHYSVVVLVSVLLVVASVATVTAGHELAGADPACMTGNDLTGSNFEIDTNANLKVDGGSPLHRLARRRVGHALAGRRVARRTSRPERTTIPSARVRKKTTPNPTIVTGSIPNNKSDLTSFGFITEARATKFLDSSGRESRAPQGTTNMDFELNQKFCDPAATPTNCSNNVASRPRRRLRTAGDMLITYDLAQRRNDADNLDPHLERLGVGPGLVISGSDATAIGVDQHLGDCGCRQRRPRFAGSVHLRRGGDLLRRLFPGTTCGPFGSAYLKSRSSDLVLAPS